MVCLSTIIITNTTIIVTVVLISSLRQVPIVILNVWGAAFDKRSSQPNECECIDAIVLIAIYREALIRHITQLHLDYSTATGRLLHNHIFTVQSMRKTPCAGSF